MDTGKQRRTVLSWLIVGRTVPALRRSGRPAIPLDRRSQRGRARPPARQPPGQPHAHQPGILRRDRQRLPRPNQRQLRRARRKRRRRQLRAVEEDRPPQPDVPPHRLAVPEARTSNLRMLDPAKEPSSPPLARPNGLAPATRLENIMAERQRGGRGFPAASPGRSRASSSISPLFAIPAGGRGGMQFSRGENPSLIFEFNPGLRPRRHAARTPPAPPRTGGTLEYQVEVLTRATPARRHLPIRSRGASGRQRRRVRGSLRLPLRPDLPPRRDAARTRAAAAADRRRSGRWQMFVRHRAGSLEAVVAQARWRNLAVTAGVLLLMMAQRRRPHHLHPPRPEARRSPDWISSPASLTNSARRSP